MKKFVVIKARKKMHSRKGQHKKALEENLVEEFTRKKGKIGSSRFSLAHKQGSIESTIAPATCSKPNSWWLFPCNF